ncbi:hypothetical protein C1O66_16870 [Paucibacter aquatile]|uniref:Uncharacterized protein n=1 Tax=Kinneretia aquatilis TaxID=2070761 RepID=A0A2N8L011_9BURK|nr:hypothetical protein C1O66_16870 [Paucibacter aquatile]
MRRRRPSCSPSPTCSFCWRTLKPAATPSAPCWPALSRPGRSPCRSCAWANAWSSRGERPRRCPICKRC